MSDKLLSFLNKNREIIVSQTPENDWEVNTDYMNSLVFNGSGMVLTKDLFLELLEDLCDSSVDFGKVINDKHGMEQAADNYELACKKIFNAVDVIFGK
jgi:hypothetical protein